MADDLRQRYAEAIRKAADYPIVAEWICCDPINPDHELCNAGNTAREMLRAVLADDPERLFLPSGVVDAVMAVRDEDLETVRSAYDIVRGQLSAMRKEYSELMGEMLAVRDSAEKDYSALARVRALHPSYEEARAAECVLCLECAQVAPCRTRRDIDALPERSGQP